MSRVWFLAAALADVQQAARWYQAEDVGLAEEFVQAVSIAVDRIKQFPSAAPEVHRGIRRHLIARFPYCLY